MTVQDIFNFLNEKFPVETACDFDNPGILVGDPAQTVTKALVALDCTESALIAARENGCQLIITHHPVIFNPLKNVLVGSAVYELIKSGISVISMHTNLDVGTGGVNDCLCRAIGLQKTEKLAADDGYLLSCGVFSPALSADELAERLKAALGGAVTYCGTDKKISRVLICSGSGGKYLTDAAKRGFDALITADVKHDAFIDAERLNTALFDAGHFATEDVVVEPLRALLAARFDTVNFLADHTSKIKNL